MVRCTWSTVTPLLELFILCVLEGPDCLVLEFSAWVLSGVKWCRSYVLTAWPGMSLRGQTALRDSLYNGFSCPSYTSSNCCQWNPENAVLCYVSTGSGSSALQQSTLPGGNALGRNTSPVTSARGVDLFGLPFFFLMQKYPFFEWTVLAFCRCWFAFQPGSFAASWSSLCAGWGGGVTCVSSL